MRNLKVTMGFRGTNYHGFQRQPNGITVQEVVETALSKLFNEPVTIQGCSRTDTGVHAKEYCFTMQTEKQLPERNFIRGACGYLPEDISIYRVEEMPADFHARFSCKAKEYMYRIHNSESKNPFTTDLELQIGRTALSPQAGHSSDAGGGTAFYRDTRLCNVLYKLHRKAEYNSYNLRHYHRKAGEYRDSACQREWIFV